MNPTFFVEDIEERSNIPDYVGENTEYLLGLMDRILPRHCPCKCHGITPGALGECERCDNAGFLYPDPPDWWRTNWWTNIFGAGPLVAPGAGWHVFCRLLWRVLGIVE